MKFNPFPENPVELTDISASGKAVGRIDGKPVFVEGGVPGDVVLVRILKSKKDFAEAKVIEVITPSPQRIEPICAHFGTCGGCKWQHFDYDTQLHYKEKQVKETLRRIGNIEAREFLPILPSPQTTFYRNKLDFSFSEKPWIADLNSAPEFPEPALGFHVPGCFDKVLNIDHCHLMQEPANRIRNFVRSYALEKNLTFNNQKAHTGFLRQLILRSNRAGEFMIILVCSANKQEVIEDLLNAVQQTFSEVVSIFYSVTDKKNDSTGDLEMVHFFGKEFLIETLGGLQFRIHPKSFFQTNPEQAENLFQRTLDFAEIKSTDLVFDLYCGTGSISLLAAQKAKQVLGLEYVEEAIADARINAATNGITNAQFLAGDLKELLNEKLIEQFGSPDLIITDPPRVGMHPDVVASILQIAPPRIVYVSCNPATQARDLGLLSANYSVAKVQPVDMFPHTQHVESVALLLRN